MPDRLQLLFGGLTAHPGSRLPGIFGNGQRILLLLQADILQLRREFRLPGAVLFQLRRQGRQPRRVRFKNGEPLLFLSDQSAGAVRAKAVHLLAQALYGGVIGRKVVLLRGEISYFGLDRGGR